jgi:hypothetical protein
MKQIIFNLIIFSTLTSCATILNQPITYMHIRTTGPAKIVHGNDTIETKKNKALLTLERRREPITITTITDSIRNQIIINSRNSIAYKYNLFNLGIGMLIDKNDPKRYEYPWTVKINPTDTSVKIYDYYQVPKKGNILLHISLPWINSFYFRPDYEKVKLNTGFWGVTLGLDYFYNDKQFLNLSATAVSDFFLPIPAVVDLSGEFEFMGSTYLSLSNNHKIQRLSLGYGISYTRNTWQFKYIDRFDPPSPTREPVKKSWNSFGLFFSSYYQIGRRFNFGIVYRPSFIRPNTADIFKYEHLISIDFAWRIKLNK